MINIPKIKRPKKDIVEKIKNLGSATVSGTLYGMGISNPFIMGPTTKTPGKSVAGPAITLQFLPKEKIFIMKMNTVTQNYNYIDTLYIKLNPEILL